MPISEAEALLDVRGIEAGYGKIGPAWCGPARRGRRGGGAARPERCREDNAAARPDRAAALGRRQRPVRWSRERGAGPRGPARAGLVHVVEGHRVFTQLSVTDNLLLAAYDLPRRERAARIEEALAVFPEIAGKRHERGGALSGGQQQMLAVAQGLVRRPRLLLLDEPSAGLSPVLVGRVLGVVSEPRGAGTAVLLVEQLIDKALAVSDRVYAMSQGRIVLEASTDEADLPRRLERAYFGSEAASA